MQKSSVSRGLICACAALSLVTGIAYSLLGDVVLPKEVLSLEEKQAYDPNTPFQPQMRFMPAPPLPPIGHRGNILRAVGGEDVLQTAIARSIKQSSAPESRMKDFDALFKNPNFRFTGWEIEIVKTERVNGVETASITAIPCITSRGGASASVGCCVNETYELQGQDLKLLKSDAKASGGDFCIFGGG